LQGDAVWYFAEVPQRRSQASRDHIALELRLSTSLQFNSSSFGCGSLALASAQSAPTGRIVGRLRGRLFPLLVFGVQSLAGREPGIVLMKERLAIATSSGEMVWSTPD
jgi:hypothetical protein